MSTEEYGQSYWFDDPIPEFKAKKRPYVDSGRATVMAQMKLYILRGAIKSSDTLHCLTSMGPDVIRLTHLPASLLGRRELIPDRDITLFQFSKRAVEKFPELADLPFRKFDPTKGAA